uniref:Secreted protein n=1 Tax=Globodera pallida TaxID=36090 RepID=A0A183C5E2_GLOPA
MSKLLCNASVHHSALLAVVFLIATFDHSDAMPMPEKMSNPFSEKPSAKKFWSPSTSGEFSGQEWTPQGSPMLIPYASGNGFISPLPSSPYDRSAVYLVDEQYMPNNKRSTGEGSFMDPSGGAGWLSLREPGRLEWNFNRLR